MSSRRRVLPSGETSRESQVPWLVVNSTLRAGSRGRVAIFFASSAAREGTSRSAAISKEKRTDFMHASRHRDGTVVFLKDECQSFLRNHREAIAAMDFFTVPTITFSVFYCFFVISHDRRRILHVNVTKHPTSGWIIQQLREAFPFQASHKYLIFDRDQKFGFEVIAAVKATGMIPKQRFKSKGVRIPFELDRNMIFDLGATRPADSAVLVVIRDHQGAI